MTTETNKTATDYGTLCDYNTGERIRPATREERDASRAEAERDDTGVIVVDGRSCYVEE